MENNLRPSYHDSSRYWLMLKDLNDSVKIELIALLSNSVAHSVGSAHGLAVKGPTRDSDKDWATRFAGAWKDNRSTQEILDDIRESRTTNTREISL